MKNYRKLIYVLFLLPALAVSAQCRYCMSFEDFMEGRWEPLDTVFVDSHSKSHQFWVGGNDFTLSTGDKKTDKMLKKEAFAVKVDRKLFVNCRNLVFEKSTFGNGYAQAMTLDQRGVFFVNKKIGKSSRNLVAKTSAMAIFVGVPLATIGTAVAVSNQLSNQVCYLVSKREDGANPCYISMIDDIVMPDLLGTNTELINEYYSESDPSKRLQAAHILPILKKAGLFKKLKQ